MARNCAAIPPGPTGSTELLSGDLPVFHSLHDARSRYSYATMQTIQVRPSRNPRWQKRGGWEVFEAEGVCPAYCGPNAREEALSYAPQRAGMTPTEIRPLDAKWNVVKAISPQPMRGLI